MNQKDNDDEGKQNRTKPNYNRKALVTIVMTLMVKSRSNKLYKIYEQEFWYLIRSLFIGNEGKSSKFS
jgi:hypothetical protein